MGNEIVALNQVAKVEMTKGNFVIKGYDDLEKAIKNEVAKYENLVIAYDDKKSIKAGKDVRASLNSIVKTIDDYRKEYKKEYLKPLNEFEDRLNALKDIAVKGADNIKNALDEVEERRKADKKKEIDKWIEELSEGFGIPFNDKWLNATAKDNDIRAQIIDLVEQEKTKKIEFENNSKIIASFAEMYGQQPDGWIAQLEYSTVTEIQQRMKAIYEAEKEKQRQHEELEKKNAELLKQQEEIVEIIEDEEEEITTEKTDSEKYADFLFGDFYEDEEKKIYKLSITVTNDELIKVKEFMRENNILFTLIDNIEDEVVDEDDFLPWQTD